MQMDDLSSLPIFQLGLAQKNYSVTKPFQSYKDTIFYIIKIKPHWLTLHLLIKIYNFSIIFSPYIMSLSKETSVL